MGHLMINERRIWGPISPGPSCLKNFGGVSGKIWFEIRISLDCFPLHWGET